MKVTAFNPTDNLKSSHRRDVLDKAWTLIALDTGKTLIEIRTYYTGSRCYACTWVRDHKGLGYASGSGFAGGGGYCKRSASVATALENAGFRFDESISGRGETAIRDAIESIARRAGIKSRFVIVESHA